MKGAAIAADLIVLAACAFGMDVHTCWLLASSYRPLQDLAAVCCHPQGSHQEIVGVRDSTGAFVSRYTAEYPQHW